MAKKVSAEINAFRAGIEDRAKWFYLLVDEMDKENVDTEKIADKAITRFGQEKGSKMENINNAADFAKALTGGYGNETFSMELCESSPEYSELRFFYCPLVESWKKMGLKKEEISRLCRLARCGDLGMVSNFSFLELEFGDLLAEGQDYCQLKIKKRS